jgi:hypothetical protein
MKQMTDTPWLDCMDGFEYAEELNLTPEEIQELRQTKGISRHKQSRKSAN